MRNIAMVPGILALLLSGLLLYVVYHKPVNTQMVAAGSSESASQPFRIAYFNLDSLEAHYDYFKDVLSQVKGKENEMNVELSGMEKGYQKKISEWQKKGNTMSQTESEQAQQEYAQMQQAYQVRKQTLQESLLKHNEDLKADIRKKIEDYLRDYNKGKEYNYIISYESNSFIYVKDTAYNITGDLITGLNALYKKK
ncbi:MAG: OmpH family outer membrane protein [Chitinophagales bacterium]